jgi:hypothetical protein
MQHKCVICGEPTDKPVQSAFSHFWLYAPGALQYLRGNIRAFGFWSGAGATLALACPLYNTVRHWKHRKARLEIGGKHV